MKGLFFGVFLFSALFSYSGTIDQIGIIGNKITKNHIIFRELTFKKGDYIDSIDCPQAIKDSRNNLLNTTLFNFVTINFKDSLEFTNVEITVVERWYLWPEVIIKFQDRNFTEWLKTKNFSRIDYGLNITRKNFRGRQEILQFQFKYGFNKKIGLNYQIPYFNKKMKDGFKISFSYNTQNDVFTSIDSLNKMIYIKNIDQILLETYNGHLEYTRRNNFYIRHTLMADFFDLQLHDTLSDIGKNYIGSTNQKQFISLSYIFKNDHRDSRNYPLNGYYFDTEIKHFGIGIDNSKLNISLIKLNIRKYFRLSSMTYYAVGAYLLALSDPEIPFYFQDGLGFNQYIRGYEPYVVFGQVNSVLKNNFKFQLIKPRSHKIPLLKSDKFSRIHYAAFCNTYVDMGYVYQIDSKSNLLENKFLIGAGMGIDLVSFYDLVWRAEYSINKNLQHGFYLSFVAPI